MANHRFILNTNKCWDLIQSLRTSLSFNVKKISTGGCLLPKILATLLILDSPATYFFPTDWYMNIYGKDWYSTPTGQFTGVTQIRKPFGHLKVSDQLYMSKSWGSDGLIYKLTDERISI
jgi:hypothetical protein